MFNREMIITAFRAASRMIDYHAIIDKPSRSENQYWELSEMDDNGMMFSSQPDIESYEHDYAFLSWEALEAFIANGEDLTELQARAAAARQKFKKEEKERQAEEKRRRDFLEQQRERKEYERLRQKFGE